MQLRIAPSLGKLEGDPYEVWGCSPYHYPFSDTVFMGLYSLNDFNVLRNHKGKKYVFWCGSDLRHFDNGYWLDETGDIRISPKPIAEWLKRNCEHWVENSVESDLLATYGIKAYICPSFMGDVNDYEISYQPNGHYYASVSGDNFDLYGWNEIEGIAKAHPENTYYLYGNTKPWKAKQKNIIVRGRIPKEQMNAEIKQMTGGLRTLRFDGASEIVMKSLLWGQYPISFINYPGCNLVPGKEPNYEGRQWALDHLNKYPWNSKIK